MLGMFMKLLFLVTIVHVAQFGNAENLKKQYVVKLFGDGARTGLTTTQRMHQKTHPKNVVRVVESHAFASVLLTENEKAEIEKHDDVEFVEEDAPRYLLHDVSKSRDATPTQIIPWGIKRVQADKVQFRGNVKVCVVDSGYDVTHPDLPPATGTTLNPLCPWYEDDFQHGTHVAGTIAAINNDFGVVGVLPSNVQIHNVRMCFFSASELAEAVLACVAEKADVINLSLGGPIPSRIEEMAFDYALQQGTLSFASSGNAGLRDSPTAASFPASFETVVSVGATDIDNQRATFSSHNEWVELAGPGVDVVSSIPGTSLSVVSKGKIYPGTQLGNTPLASAVGTLIDCGNGTSPCENALNNICLVMRSHTERDYTPIIQNCEHYGGIGAILYNFMGGNFFSGSVTESQIPAILLGNDFGAKLRALVGSTVKISAEQRYQSFDGTSMAAPHVTGVAALVWSNMRMCSASSVRNILSKTALDLGAPGRDIDFGFGLVQAKDAVDYFGAHGCADASPTSAPTPVPIVRWDMSGSRSMSHTYACNGPCVAFARWELSGACGLNESIVVTVSPKLSDFSGFLKGLVVTVNDTRQFCFDIGTCNTTQYFPGACLNQVPFTNLVGPGVYDISVAVTPFVRSCPISGTDQHLDTIVTLECANLTDMTRSVPVTTTSPPSGPIRDVTCGSTTELASTTFTDFRDVRFTAPARHTIRVHTCPSLADSIIALFNVSANLTKASEIASCDDDCGFCAFFSAGVQYTTSSTSEVLIASMALFGNGTAPLVITCDPIPQKEIVHLPLAKQNDVSQIYECVGRGCTATHTFNVIGTCSRSLTLTVSPKITEFHNAFESMSVKVNGILAKTCEFMGFCATERYATGKCMKRMDISRMVGANTTFDVQIGISYGVNQCAVPPTSNQYLDAKVTLSCGVANEYASLSCGKYVSGYIAPFEHRSFRLQTNSASSFTLDACESKVDTVLSVLEVSSYGALNKTWECDDCGACGSGTKHTFNATSFVKPGLAYVVNLRGLSASSGAFKLRLGCGSGHSSSDD